MARTREESLQHLEDLNRRAVGGGGDDHVARQHAAGRFTARERLALLLDEGTFVEFDRLVSARGDDRLEAPGESVVTGSGEVDGRRVFVFAQDATVDGGSVSAAHAAKVCKVIELARQVGAPIVGLHDSSGARVADGVASLAACADLYRCSALASGEVPQLAAVLGPCVGAAVFAPGLSDLVAMTDGTSSMFVSGPEVIRAVTHESVTREELGGAMAHASRSGVAHFAAADERACLALLRAVLGFLPSSHRDDPPRRPCGDPADRADPRLDAIVPAGSAHAYDIRDVVTAVVDHGHLVEVQAHHAMNIVCAFARIDGRPVGVVANQPAVLAGCLDVLACVKAARFVRLCDAFNVPLITFVDVPGFLPGADQEHGGIIKHGAKLLLAYAESTVPKVTVVTGRAYGAAYAMMASKQLGAGVHLAWPTAEVAVMGADGAVQALFGADLERAANPAARRALLAEEYQSRYATLYPAAERGLLDEVIAPRMTRPRIARALALLDGRRGDRGRKKHGNLPL